MTHHVPEVVSSRVVAVTLFGQIGKYVYCTIFHIHFSLWDCTHASITSAFGDRRVSHSALDTSGSSGETIVDLDTRAPKHLWHGTQSSGTLPHVSCLQLSNSPIGSGHRSPIRIKRVVTTSLAAATAAAGGMGFQAGVIGSGVGTAKSKYRK